LTGGKQPESSNATVKWIRRGSSFKSTGSERRWQEEKSKSMLAITTASGNDPTRHPRTNRSPLKKRSEGLLKPSPTFPARPNRVFDEPTTV